MWTMLIYWQNVFSQNEDMQQQIIKETFQLVSKRDDNVCNFLEGGSLIGGSDYKLIYRHYATLYFVFCVDSSESELGILDLIQVFVETLDKCFENVCELDLIFHVDKVHYILNELVMGGMVLETNMTEILTRIEEQNKLEKQEVVMFLTYSFTVLVVLFLWLIRLQFKVEIYKLCNCILVFWCMMKSLSDKTFICKVLFQKVNFYVRVTSNSWIFVFRLESPLHLRGQSLQWRIWTFLSK